MPWPLFILIPIILMIVTIAVAPDILSNPSGYSKNRKITKEAIYKAKSKKTLFETSLTIRQTPMMLGYNQYRVSGFHTIYFKENCIYYRVFGFIEFVLDYNEIESVRLEKESFILGYSLQLKFKLKDKDRASLILGIGKNEGTINEIEKAIGIPIERMI